MLFWEAVQCNKRFRTFVVDGERGTDFAALVIIYALENKADPGKQGIVRMCVFILQTLSTEPQFGKNLNEEFTKRDLVQSMVEVPDTSCSHADFLIMVMIRNCR